MKIQQFMEYMNQKTYVELDKFQKEQFLKMAVCCIENADEMKEDTLEEIKEYIKNKAEQVAKLIEEKLK